jgi:site-specific DNA-methyltransferase (adenine-specific)
MTELSLPKEPSLRKPEDYLLIEGEAVEEVRKLASHSVDLVLTDPPFNHETEHYDTRQSKFLSASMKSFADFAIMRSHFADFSKEVYRVLKPKGRVLLFCDCTSFPIFWAAFYGYWNHIRGLIWYKGKGYFSLGVNQAFRYSYEMILHCFNTDSWFDLSQRQDVITNPNVPSSQRLHPAQKPLDLLMRLITATCPPNGIILNPYCGSGSTLVAAKHLKRKAIGIDANPEFIKIAKARLGAISSQLETFVEVLEGS